jgi:hypothetical protein
MPGLVLPPVRQAFRAIAQTVVPEAATMGESEWMALEGLVEQLLSQRPALVHRQLGILIHAIEYLPLLTTGRRFSGLDAARRARFLGRLASAPLLLLRRGVWGLRTLVFLGYYARPGTAAAIGYRADRRGWEARR